MFKIDITPLELTQTVDLGAAPALGSSAVQGPVSTQEPDDLAREVYGILGMPIDALDRASVLQRIVCAAQEKRPFLLSTPNVNFLMSSRRDAEFRESLLHSDLCVPDGMPIVWLSRLLAVPIEERVSGSDLFDAIRSHSSPSHPARIFLFGGAGGVAETVCGILNSRPTGMRCVGWLSPGFGTVDEMSSEGIIAKINRSNADLLAVFLSAKKAQSWLVLNHNRLTVPVRGQFGSTINYQAGTVRRAPMSFQRLGLEWLWRIKEEPYLWRRYWKDGLSLARLVITRALPIAVDLGWRRYIQKNSKQDLSIEKHEHHGSIVASLLGYATEKHVIKSATVFRGLVVEHRDVAIDVSQTRSIDPRFFGLFLMLRKQLKKNGKTLKFTGVSKKSRRMFRLNGFEFLLETDPDSSLETTRSKMSN
jgi:N-acetylglucosaminyldiphosphoundecaprenol N-acetyl-beta-D-mannosaminyltransferase